MGLLTAMRTTDPDARTGLFRTTPLVVNNTRARGLTTNTED
jgi:hypothetical protein